MTQSPAQTPDRREDLPNRQITFEWDLGVAIPFGDSEYLAKTQLIVGHSKGHGFTARILRVDTQDHELYRSQMFTVYGGTALRLPSKPVSRYSAKGLRDFADATLSAVEAGDYDVAAVFDPSNPA